MCVGGDLDLSDTIIHGSLKLWMVCVSGNLNLSHLKIEGRLYSLPVENKSDSLLNEYGLIGVDGEIDSDGFEVNGMEIELPRSFTRVPMEDRDEIDLSHL